MTKLKNPFYKTQKAEKLKWKSNKSPRISIETRGKNEKTKKQSRKKKKRHIPVYIGSTSNLGRNSSSGRKVRIIKTRHG